MIRNNDAGQIDFGTQYDQYKTMVESSLLSFLGQTGEPETAILYEAARYSLMAGGKRIRPVLMLATATMLGLPSDVVMPYCCAIEMIHTYSLIHDDLPAMDNDDLRRGKPTCHIAYGEATAILAGDFLLNRAYEIILDTVRVENPHSIAAARLISQAAGGNGMIGGQIMDMVFENQAITRDMLQRMHQKKTGSLIVACVMLPLLFCQTEQQLQQAFRQYGKAIGLAFQIRDDILDVTASANQLGKTPEKDERDGKTTFVSLLGREEAEHQLAATTTHARQALQVIHQEYDCTFLMEMTDFLLRRSS